MSVLPTDIARTARGLRITWSDNLVTEFTARQLRDACPCATCREKRRAAEPEEVDSDQAPAPRKPMGLPVLSAQETRPMAVLGMRPVGNYAYNIAFSDGHDSGLFTLDFLRALPTGTQGGAPGESTHGT
ncbi:hypothetical protein Poly24_49910 [Rosistilla carotiformis]|uniref:Gamma-butyrobetaine hydroxylase-like N-terminal domain-containing protein n=1 Tax=Rosistilla carotiformis TaxID=2528017 RepID=A0A518K0D0_9BACT|nr:DUF971 domain-containing protein [Rosistilla carotiformis]QDV71256.1 hypothetical protein Poly24_49910 [Rosistilla carotiformis]